MIKKFCSQTYWIQKTLNPLIFNIKLGYQTPPVGVLINKGKKKVCMLK